MTTPLQTLQTIPQELDASDWQLEIDHTDIQVYSKSNASNSGVIGFKTITEHPIPQAVVINLLKDVCGAMHRINDLFVLGEQLRTWSVPIDSEGSLVRTSFQMPFPMVNREFLHGLHSQKLDDKTYLVGYTPTEALDIPVQKNYVRCPMSISGQRISIVDSGTTKVEHLMVYRLGGAIGPFIQDHFLKKSHINAYIKEWRNLRTFLYPTPIDQINYTQLANIALNTLQVSATWATIGKPKVGQVRVGRLPYSPRSAFRTDIVVEAPLTKVVDVIADQSLKYLPQWNKEFIQGNVLKIVEESPKKMAWIIQVHYQTPPLLANREYIYYFSREWLNDKEALIIYNSIQHPSPVPKGFVRGLLYPTVHRCIYQSAHSTKIEHILVTDLKGNLSTFQDSLLKAGLAQAHCRDMENQNRLFQDLS
ncbi:START domain-containing protein [Aureispira sp. CCB-QB1]|uniref:START domain-containing protein n=1 Tax=Aureispira sp. CCB-QB1 TaxID=1313421 RepID=UPI0006990FD4|nr:START domain-containing protein [Aureispira sp. CCB-QB1]